MGTDVRTVKDFWEGHVNNEYYTKYERGSREYFTQIEERRYKYHYHLPELFAAIAADGTAGKRLLEIGCGIGIDTRQLAKLGFEEIVAADLTKAATDIARRRFAEEGIAGVRFEVENAESLSFTDSSFDVVYSFGVIHHTPRIENAVAEIHRVLKPGGKAHVMIYHSRSIVDWLHRLLRLPYEAFGGDAPVTDRFNRRQALELFGDFAEVEVHADYPFTYGMRHLSALVPIALQRRLGRWLGWHLMITAEKKKA